MITRTAESLVAEFREEVHNKIPSLKAIVEGERRWLQATLSTPEQRNHSAVWWIRAAHLGTLEKLSTMLRRDGPYESLELLAIARNIFENLVWLRLMNSDRQFGLVFYAQLLRNQIESVQAVLRKVADEATLFDEFEGLDSDAMETKFLEGMKAGRLKEEVIREAIAAQWLQSDQLDDLMRREFSLYASQATQNGYGFQAHLIRTKVIPEYENRLRELEDHKRLLDAELPAIIDARHLGLANASKWNWFDRASDVRMDSQYRFLYSFTSKLLHAIPLNIITDKELSSSEMMMVLDYIVISAADILKAVKDFSYPGQIRVIEIDAD